MHAYAVQLSFERKAVVLELCATLCIASLKKSTLVQDNLNYGAILLEGIQWNRNCAHGISAIPDVSWLCQLVAVIGMQVHNL